MIWFILAVLIGIYVGFLVWRDEESVGITIMMFCVITCTAWLIFFIVSFFVGEFMHKEITETRHTINSLEPSQTFTIGIMGKYYLANIDTPEGKRMKCFDAEKTPIKETSHETPYYIQKTGKVVGWRHLFIMCDPCATTVSYVLVLPEGYKIKHYNRMEER